MASFLFEGGPIEAKDGQTVLGALLESGVQVPNGCRAGACQSCVLRSSDPVPTESQAGLDESLVELGAFLSCRAKADQVGAVERLSDRFLPAFPAQLVSSEFARDDVLLLKLRCEGFAGTPGRFIRLIHSTGVARPYSLAAPAWEEESTIRLHVRLVPGGPMSQFIRDAQAGEPFLVQGPFGKCRYKPDDPHAPLVLIGSGTGIAPLYAIATDAIHKGHKGTIRLYVGAANSGDLYFRQALTDLEDRSPHFRFIGCVDEEPSVDDRLGSPLVHALSDHPDMTGHRLFLCGNPALVRAAQRKCFLAGANLKDIAADAFESSPT